MKKVIFITVFLFSAVIISAQGKFTGFFKPVPNNLVEKPMTYGLSSSTGTSVWIFRPTVQLSAMQIYRNKETKAWESAQFSSAGVGISYQHFISANGTAVSNYGFTALLLFDASDVKTTISPAVTFNALQYVNFGAGYNTSLKQVFGLIGIQYNFN